MIDKDIKRSLGQMIKGVYVVAYEFEGLARAFTSHWVCQVSFEEPIVMSSVSPKHDTYPLIKNSGKFSVSILASDQIVEGQYFSYPGRKFMYSAPEYLVSNTEESLPIVPNSIAYLFCEVFDVVERFDHDIFFAEVKSVSEGRLGEPPLLYSARHGWRKTGDKARDKGVSVRDMLLERVDQQQQEQQ